MDEGKEREGKREEGERKRTTDLHSQVDGIELTALSCLLTDSRATLE
jgi:hypothetical protein